MMELEGGGYVRGTPLIHIHPPVAFTFMVSPSISTTFSLKSTPMVASVLSGKLPPVKRKVRQVFPTLESPMTMILKIRVWMLSSSEEVLRSTEDVRLGAASLLLLARLRLALWKSMEDVKMVTLSSARFLCAIPLPPPPPPPPGARVSSSGESLVIMPEEAMRKSGCVREEERGWTDGRMSEGRGKEEEGRRRPEMQQYQRCSHSAADCGLKGRSRERRENQDLSPMHVIFPC